MLSNEKVKKLVFTRINMKLFRGLAPGVEDAIGDLYSHEVEEADGEARENLEVVSRSGETT